jgi:hypothetical protein
MQVCVLLLLPSPAAGQGLCRLLFTLPALAPAVLPPGSGHSLCICGLSGSERHLFMSVLMHFGPPFIHRQPDLGWAPYHQHLVGKTRSQVRTSSRAAQLLHYMHGAGLPL